jgi:hypothetical protein
MGDFVSKLHVRLFESFLNHKKLIKTSRRLGVNIVQTRGHLITLWLNVLQHYPDGVLNDCDAEDIAIYSEWDGDSETFLNALLSQKLLDESPGQPGSDQETTCYVIHDWDDHCGLKEIKEQRRKEREKKRKQRQNKKDLQNQAVTEMSPGTSGVVPPMSPTEREIETEISSSLSVQVDKQKHINRMSFGPAPEFPIQTADDFELCARHHWGWNLNHCQLNEKNKSKMNDMLMVNPMTEQEAKEVLSRCIDRDSPWVNVAIFKFSDIRRTTNVVPFRRKKTMQENNESNIKAIMDQVYQCQGKELEDLADQLDIAEGRKSAVQNG